MKDKGRDNILEGEEKVEEEYEEQSKGHRRSSEKLREDSEDKEDERTEESIGMEDYGRRKEEREVEDNKKEEREVQVKKKEEGTTEGNIEDLGQIDLMKRMFNEIQKIGRQQKELGEEFEEMGKGLADK